jgi:DnaJ-class molecular chaperone
MTAFWMDDRKLVITSEQRKTMGSDYQHTYNIPCKKVRGKVKPLYTCQHCKGSGDEPEAEYDRCDVCRGSGGMPAAATEKGQP